MRPHRLQLLQAFRAGDKERRVEFCDKMLQNMEDDSFLPRLIFSDEATFLLTGKVIVKMYAYGEHRIPGKLKA
jgi:hypothetical protein